MRHGWMGSVDLLWLVWSEEKSEVEYGRRGSVEKEKHKAAGLGLFVH